MMGKEHFIKEFGVPVYTVSVGCSGGSYGSAQPADALPGLYDGVLIACTFPDPLAIASSGLDAHLLAHYFDATAPGAFTEAQQVAVSGYKGRKAFIDAANQAERTDPVPGRAGRTRLQVGGLERRRARGAALRSEDQPEGRAADHLRPRPQRLRRRPGHRLCAAHLRQCRRAVRPGRAERRRDHPEAVPRPQRGRSAATTRTPTTSPLARSAISGAIRRAYQSGLELSGGGGLASIPVFDISGIYNDDGGYHYQWFHFALRERMSKANGNARNHVMWRGQPGSLRQGVDDLRRLDGGDPCRRGGPAAPREDPARHPARRHRRLLDFADRLRRRAADLLGQAAGAPATRASPRSASRAWSPAARSRPTC